MNLWLIIILVRILRSRRRINVLVDDSRARDLLLLRFPGLFLITLRHNQQVVLRLSCRINGCNNLNAQLQHVNIAHSVPGLLMFETNLAAKACRYFFEIVDALHPLPKRTPTGRLLGILAS